ncbi:hypothetical protein ABZT45_34230 [Streptomyces sp. NPDC005356]
MGPGPLSESTPQREPTRLEDATHRGTVEAATMARVDQALRAVLDL